MKKKLKLTLLFLIVVSSSIFTACQKNDDLLTPDTSLSNGTNAAGVSNAVVQGKPMQVTITNFVPFTNFPHLSGTFIATGALNISGSVTDDVFQNQNGIRAHCIFTYTTSGGTITIHDENEFAVSNANPFGKGQWQIVSGTGAYANLQGGGDESFPDGGTGDVLTGIIHE